MPAGLCGYDSVWELLAHGLNPGGEGRSSPLIDPNQYGPDVGGPLARDRLRRSLVENADSRRR